MSYFEQRSQRAARQIGYGSFFDAPQEPYQNTLTPEQRDALLESIGGRTAQAAESLFSALDTPASWLRDVLAGQQLGSGTTPGQLLDAYNLRPSKESLGGWGRPIAEFAVGAVADPLNLIPIGGLSKAGAALKARTTLSGVNALDDAARVMGRKLIATNQLDDVFAKNALASWKTNFGKTASDLTDADLLSRPIAGARATRRSLTLDEVVRAQPNSQQMMDDITAWLSKNGGGRYDDIAKQTLTKDIGIRLPFSDRMMAGVNLPGGGALSGSLDRIFQAARWSAPVRHGYAALDRDVFGAVDEGGQIVGKQIASAMREGEAAGGRLAADVLQDLNPDSMLGPRAAEIGDSMRRVMTGNGTPQDLALVASRPDLQRFVARAKTTLQDYLDKRAAAGMSSSAYTSNYGNQYFPRHVDDLNFLAKIEKDGAAGGVRRGRAFSGNTPDQLSRAKYLDMPGGEDTINRLSLDPNVAGASRRYQDELSAARYIKQQVDAEIVRRFPSGRLPSGQAVPKYRLNHARRAARLLAQVDDAALANRLPLFGAHLTDDFTRYIKNNERALRVNNRLFDLIGSTATPRKWDSLSGHVPIIGAGPANPDSVLKRLGLRTTTDAAGNLVGARAEVLSRLQSRFPGAVADLKSVSLDKRMLDRLSRIADFYDYPEVQSKWIQYFDAFTRIWKASILSWPARFTRDWYSGAFSNLVEVGSVTDLSRGYAGAKHLLQGDWQMLDAVLAKAPRYAQMSASSRKREFINDLASAGLLGGQRRLDMQSAAGALRTGASVADEFLPGAAPRTTLGNQAIDFLLPRGALGSRGTPLGLEATAYSELGQNWGRFFGGLNPREIGNPIMRWGNKLGDTTDTINRTSGFIGLVLQGVDPLEAGRRIKASHVDYGSLTKLERETFRRFIPFWSYGSRTGKWVAQKIWENPGGRFTQFGMRAPNAFLQSEDEGYVPDSIRSSYGLPISGGAALPFGGTKQGVTPWLTDIDLPGIDQINLVNLGFKPSGRIDLTQTALDTGKDIIGKMSHPMIKNAIESVTGENLYTKRPTKDFPPAVSELAEDVFGISPHSVYGNYIRQLAPAVDLIPFAPRALQISNRIMDSEKIPDVRDRAYQMLINAFTGVKVQNVDDQARRADARKKIARILGEDPLIRSFTQPYLPKEAVPYADPNLVQMMSLDRELGRELQRERDMRDGKPVKARKRNTDPASYFQ